MTIGVIALKNFTQDGVQRRAGEYFETAPVQAAALRYQGKAKLSDKPAPKARRTYRRRDLVAESAAPEPTDL